MNAPVLINDLTGEVVSDTMWDSIALHIPENTSFDDWSALGRTLQQMEKSVMWWIGDWLRFGERKYGETYTQAIEATGYSNDTLRQAKWVAGAYEPCERTHNLSWSHHKEAASLPASERAEVLSRAASGNLSTRETKVLAKQEKNRVGAKHDTCTTDDLHKLIARGDKFGTIYADPPWDRKILHPMIEAFSYAQPAWLLFDADWIHTRQSAPFLPLLRKVVSVGRVKWIPNSKMTGKDNVIWGLFDRKNDGPTEFYGRTM